MFSNIQNCRTFNLYINKFICTIEKIPRKLYTHFELNCVGFFQ
nr:MAG TPA: hypothetical protein [Caudoviricetes sp.]DAR55774.1 MAG TPA: hypothetical protein [Caudoviricetes sp.]DAZ82196.1 MAG TPA: hypothetical protein [Caudoviricetes sp.]